MVPASALKIRYAQSFSDEVTLHISRSSLGEKALPLRHAPRACDFRFREADLAFIVVGPLREVPSISVLGSVPDTP